MNADLLRRRDLGRVQEGCVADLLVVDRTVAHPPAVLWAAPEHRTIIQGGVVLTR